MTDYIDHCISEYLSYGDAISCCHKLENVITDGLLLDEPTAYALLLAGLTQHLFLSEFSLVGSVANFWAGAGEFLLNLSRSSIWSTFAECQFSVLELPSFHGYKCSKCTLLDKVYIVGQLSSFGSSETQNSELEYITREFLYCIASIMPKV